MTAPEPDAVAPAAKREKPPSPPEVNCLSKVGMETYIASILQHLASSDLWLGGSEVREYCGGTKGQFNIVMRKHIVPRGLVKTKGKFGGMRYAITAKGIRRANTTIPEPTPDSPQKTSEYAKTILKFLRQNPQWHSGDDVSNACAGTIASRREALKTLVNRGLAERNGMYTTLMRYRAV